MTLSFSMFQSFLLVVQVLVLFYTFFQLQRSHDIADYIWTGLLTDENRKNFQYIYNCHDDLKSSNHPHHVLCRTKLGWIVSSWYFVLVLAIGGITILEVRRRKPFFPYFRVRLLY